MQKGGEKWTIFLIASSKKLERYCSELEASFSGWPYFCQHFSFTSQHMSASMPRWAHGEPMPWLKDAGTQNQIFNFQNHYIMKKKVKVRKPAFENFTQQSLSTKQQCLIKGGNGEEEPINNIVTDDISDG